MEPFAACVLAGAAIGAFSLSSTARLTPAGCETVTPNPGSVTVPADAVRVLRRRGGLCPSSWLSHRRRVSWPIWMPKPLRPPINDSTDSPVWRNRSNSSRCGSNCAVVRLRGQRAWATASAKVSGAVGAVREYVGIDMGVAGERYPWWLGGARGAPRAQSKRKRLDVGVHPYCFLLFLLGESGCFFTSFLGWLIRLVDFLDFVFGVFVELSSLNCGFRRFSVHSSVSIVLGFFGPSLVAGGGGC
jgi:hypothetical protein